MSWLKTNLGPHADLISGPAFESRYFTDDPSDTPLVKGENIGQGMIHWDKSKYWPRTESDGYDKFVLKPGDIVLAMDRPWISAGLKFAVISERDPEALLVQRVARIRGVNGLSSKYLRYIIASPQFSAYAKNIMGGTNVPHISGNQIRAFPFSLPPKGEQQRIASILSAYDDLIENNRRRIALLEEAARLLYREWFVHLRFPGHEHVAIKDGVPEGWEKKPLFDIAKPTYGFAFKSELFNTDGNGLPVTRIRDIPAGESHTCTTEEAPQDKLLVDGDFVIGMDGDFHMNFWTGGKAWINQRVVRIQGLEDISDAYLRYAIQRPIQDFNATIVGTTVAHLGAKHLKLIKVLVPTKGILQEAQGFFDTVQSQIVALSTQIRLAQRARDLLLPRLMNGEIAV